MTTVRHAWSRRFMLALLVLTACGAEPDTERLAELRQSTLRLLGSATAVHGDVSLRRAHGYYWETLQPPQPLGRGDWLRTRPGAHARIEWLSGGATDVPEATLVVIDDELAKRALPPPPAPLPEPLPAPLPEPPPAPLPEPPPRPVSQTRTRMELPPSPAAAVATTCDAAAPELLSPRDRAHFSWWPGTALWLRWQPVPGASGYRLQVARGAVANDPGLVIDVKDTAWLLPLASADPLSWRVAVRDTTCAQSAVWRVTFTAEPGKDELLWPADGHQSRISEPTAKVSFAWRPAQSGAYRLVVATASNLSAGVVLEHYTSQTALAVNALLPGQYFWGVFSDDEAPRPIFTAPRRLTIERVAPPRP